MVMKPYFWGKLVSVGICLSGFSKDGSGIPLKTWKTYARWCTLYNSTVNTEAKFLVILCTCIQHEVLSPEADLR